MSQVKLSQILSLIVLSFLSIFYFIYGIIKLYKRREDIGNIFKNKTNLDLKVHFSGELNKEERLALLAATPGITIALFIIVIQLLQFK
ncbi:hypothetical protein HGB13_03740 [bacterium]|nr:hypothetical protein [bacterium]